MKRLVALGGAALIAAALARFALARPAIEVRFPRSAAASAERRDLANFREGPTVRVSSVLWASRHHPGYLVDGAGRPSQLEKWVSAPGDAHPFVEVQLREPHPLEELSLELAGAHEEPALTEPSYLIECFAGERPVWRLSVAGNLAPRPRHPLLCPASDRVRVTFAPRDLARVYELELWGR